jgi:putative ABC transport system substrate-binding protein
MTRRTIGLFAVLALSLLAAPLGAGERPGKVYRVGLLSVSSPPSAPGWQESVPLLQALHDLGYVEGHNLTMAYRWAEGKAERLPELAAELVRLPVDVIVAGGSRAIRAAQHATRTIPIVMAGTSDPVVAGFVVSLARPEGNITGVSDQSAELPGKRLEILQETVPQRVRIAVLANPTSSYHASWMDSLNGAARALGLHLQVVEVRGADTLDPAFAAMTRAGAEALLVLPDATLIDSLGGRIADLAAQHRLPAIYAWRRDVDAGGLMAYGPNPRDTQRRAAIYVDKILKGAKPGDLPVEQPTTFELVINLKTAQALGLTIPPTLLLQATEVIR